MSTSTSSTHDFWLDSFMNDSNDNNNGTITPADSPTKRPLDLVVIFSIPIYIALSAIVVFLILRHYTKKSQLPWMAYGTLFLTYWILFSALSLVTIDLSSGLYAKTTMTKDDDNSPPLYLTIFWQFMYWSIQLLAWLGIPIWQSYWNGEFTVVRRLWASFLANAILYATIAIVGGILGIAVVSYILIVHKGVPAGVSLSRESIIGVAQSLSNMYGLFILISLLGYGIIDLPRYLWQHANKQRTLKFYEFQAVELEETCDSMEADLKDQLAKVLALDQLIPSIGESSSSSSSSHHGNGNGSDEENGDVSPVLSPEMQKKRIHMRKFVDEILKTCQSELNRYPRLSPADSSTVLPSDGVDGLKRSHLVKVHKDVISAVAQYRRSQYQLQYSQDCYFYLQDIVESMDASDKRIRTVYHRPPSILRRSTWWQRTLYDYPLWLYYRYLRIVLYRVSAVLIALFALVLIYCEFTPFIKTIQMYVSKSPDRRIKEISVLSLLVRWLAPSRIVLQLVSLGIIVMIAFIALFALFRIEIYSLYKLVPHHSDSFSILYTGLFLCRIVPTLCYNYLQLCGVVGDDGVAFYHVLGVLRVDGLKEMFKTTGFLEVIAGGFTNFFPLLLPVIALLTLFNVCGLVGSLFDIKRFKFNPKVDDETIEEGRRMLASARKVRLSELQQELASMDSHIDLNSGGDLNLDELEIQDSDDEFDHGTRFNKKTNRRLDELYKKHGKDRPVTKSESGNFSLRGKLGL